MVGQKHFKWANVRLEGQNILNIIKHYNNLKTSGGGVRMLLRRGGGLRPSSSNLALSDISILFPALHDDTSELSNLNFKFLYHQARVANKY